MYQSLDEITAACSTEEKAFWQVVQEDDCREEGIGREESEKRMAEIFAAKANALMSRAAARDLYDFCNMVDQNTISGKEDLFLPDSRLKAFPWENILLGPEKHIQQDLRVP